MGVNGLKPGDVIAGPRRTVTAEKMRVFEEVIWDRGPTAHNDPATAAAGGMTRPFASGQNILAFVHEMMEQSFGKGWIEGGSVSMRWLRLIYDGDIISTFCEVESIRQDGDRRVVGLKVWAQNQDGEQCAAGQATALQ